MGANIKQFPDGSAGWVNDADSYVSGRIGGPATATAGTPNYRTETTVKVPLAAVDTAGGLFAWQNPYPFDVLVGPVMLNVTTATSGACTADVGYTATNATTLADNLIDGASLTPAGVLNSEKNAGTNGTSYRLCASGKWITGSVASGASAGLVGSAYITFRPV